MTLEQLNPMYTKSEAELNKMFDSGMFNSIIRGYLHLTLREMGKSDQEIQEAKATLKEILGDVSAEQARKYY